MEIHIIYTLLIVLLGMFLDFSKRKVRLRYVVFVSFILILISGLRNIYINSDTFNYYDKFVDIGRMSFGDMWALDKDPVFYVFTKALRLLIGDRFQLYLIICSSILIIPLGRFIYRESNNPMISYLMFISLGFFSFSMVCIRQAMAIGVLLLSYDSLKQRNLKVFLLYVLLASTFHVTALLFLVIYPLSRLKYDIKVLAIYAAAIVLSIVAGSTILRSINLSLITNRFDVYLFEDTRVLSASGMIQLVFFGAFFMMYYRKISKAIPETTGLHAHLLSLAMILQGFVFFIAEFFRLSWYFKVFILVLIPLVITYSGKMRKAYTVLFVILFLAYFFYNASSMDYAFYWQQYVPDF